MNTRNITLVLTCIFLLFGTWFISFNLSNANFSVSNTSLASTHTIYVDGNNAGDPSQDGSSSHPFSTIQRGIDKSSAGDTVFVRKGYYYETMTISNSLNLVGEDMNNTIIDAINTMTSGYVVHIQSNVNDVNISGFTIQNARVNPRYGIYAEWYNRNVNIFRNRIFLNDQGIFTSHSSNITITNNEILNNTLGVNINWEDLYANVSNNTISGLWPPIGSKAISIGWGCNHTKVIGNSMANVDWCMSIDRSGWDDIVGNALNNVYEGFRLNGCYNSTFENNTINGRVYENWPYCGIELLRDDLNVPPSDSNTFSNNTLKHFSYGLRMYLAEWITWPSDTNKISNNNVVGNTVSDCGQGVNVKNTSSNYIYHNNFFNAQGVDESGINLWSESYPCGGNYWSDYSGSDTNWGENQDKPGSDMLGDTPYVKGNVIDSYPLMEPWPISNFTSTAFGRMSIGTHSYDLSAAVITSAHTTNIEFDNDTGEWCMSFYVTTDRADSCTVIIPKWLLDGTFNVLVDDTPVACSFDRSTQCHMLSFTYSSGSHNVRISAEYGKRPLLTQLPDLNGDGKVSLQDLTLLATHYGQHYP